MLDVSLRRHLRRKDAGGAVQCGESFIEERHVPADGWLAFYQVHVLAGVGNRQGRMNTSDSSATTSTSA